MNADGSQAALSSAFVQNGAINLPSVRNEGQFNTLVYSDGQLKMNMGRNIAAAGCIVSRQNSDSSWRRSDSRLVVMNAENGYPLQEALDNGGSAGISTLNSQYLNNAGQGSVLSLTPDPSPTGEGSENTGGGSTNTGGDNGGGDNGGGSAGFETGGE